MGDKGDNGHGSSYPCLSESPPNLEDSGRVSAELSGTVKADGDSANGGDEEELQDSSKSQERPRLALDILSSCCRNT